LKFWRRQRFALSEHSPVNAVALLFTSIQLREGTYNVDGDDDADDVAGDDVGPVTVVKRVPCETTQK